MSRTVHFDKMVRDNIPEIVKAEGNECNYRTLDRDIQKEEIKRYVQLKLREELREVLEEESPNAIVNELADLLEVMKKYCKINNVDWTDVLIAQAQKNGRCGTFNNNYILTSITYKDDLQ